MLILFTAYVGGLLTIISPCIVPILPLVFARAERSWLGHGLPMLLGMAIAFTAIASLAAVVGGWAVRANAVARLIAIGLFVLLGLNLLMPAIAERFARPLVAVGRSLSHADRAPRNATARFEPVLLGIGCGFLWAPCAGPVLGLVLTAAALEGTTVRTVLLLFAYACGAATSLGAALLLGKRFGTAARRVLPSAVRLRQLAGVMVLLSVAVIATGVDTRALDRVARDRAATIEMAFLRKLDAVFGSSATSAKAATKDIENRARPEARGLHLFVYLI